MSTPCFALSRDSLTVILIVVWILPVGSAGMKNGLVHPWVYTSMICQQDRPAVAVLLFYTFIFLVGTGNAATGRASWS